MRTLSKIEFGDFQTPLSLAQDICSLLRLRGIRPSHVIEPTCGEGAFLEAAATTFPNAQLHGFEINHEYLNTTRNRIQKMVLTKKARLSQQDFFTFDWESYFKPLDGSIMVLGNPPWITNSGISEINGTNRPARNNFLGLKGFDAKTGKSNFDISEWMMIQLVLALRGRNTHLALLCKTMTARKVLRFAWQNDCPIKTAEIFKISAKEHFDAAVDACLLLIEFGIQGTREAHVFDSISTPTSSQRVGLHGNDFIADLDLYERMRSFDGDCPYKWRSGVKHDCSTIMELDRITETKYQNKIGEIIELEDDFVFPLLKATDLSKGQHLPRKYVIVTQKQVGDATENISKIAPLTWNYLLSKSDLLSARKSSIYTNKARFSMFGIGSYSYAPFKVAVSGLHADFKVVLISPINGKPVMMDDTCYFLSFDTKQEAALVFEILRSDECKAFIQVLIFRDSKRPITVDVLKRLNLSAIAKAIGRHSAWMSFQHTENGLAQSSKQMLLTMEKPDSAYQSR
jgi:hypothetical protein